MSSTHLEADLQNLMPLPCGDHPQIARRQIRMQGMCVSLGDHYGYKIRDIVTFTPFKHSNESKVISQTLPPMERNNKGLWLIIYSLLGMQI